MDQLSFVVGTIKLDLFEDSFVTAAHDSHRVDGVVVVDAD